MEYSDFFSPGLLNKALMLMHMFMFCLFDVLLLLCTFLCACVVDSTTYAQQISRHSLYLVLVRCYHFHISLYAFSNVVTMVTMVTTCCYLLLPCYVLCVNVLMILFMTVGTLSPWGTEKCGNSGFWGSFLVIIEKSLSSDGTLSWHEQQLVILSYDKWQNHFILGMDRHCQIATWGEQWRRGTLCRHKDTLYGVWPGRRGPG